MGSPPPTRSASQIRREFIDFFVDRHGHTHVPGSPVVPHDDPTLLFTNAGMNQFKPLFLGTADRGSAFGRLRRAANSQPCIRAGGKHNDLDDVGHDTYHHTCFEMLGNWSFGDYFKKEAIAWAWELLTKVWGIDPERLHATYFGGLPKTKDASQPSRDHAQPSRDREGAVTSSTTDPDDWELEPDLESRDLWLRYLPPERVHPGGAKDNFWEMGETGPCGPCSEIHIDLTPDCSGGHLVNAGDARVMEIWNLVFIQFNRGPDGGLTPLPDKHVDTGMGFERICAVIRGFETGRVGQVTNYDTDVFAPLFAAIAKATGAPPYGGRLESALGGGTQPDASTRDAVMRDVAYRVIADHVRTLVFAISDGALPDKEGRGYVLRRILRRAVRYGWQYLNMHKPFLHRIVPAVVERLGEAFPRLGERPKHVVEVIREEETSFARTLERGIALFEEAARSASGPLPYGRGSAGAFSPDGDDRAMATPVIRGEDAFKLHDTYGFPIDLTQIMAAERGMTVDVEEYERLMEEAREKARGVRAIATPELHPDLPSGLAHLKTDDSAKYTCVETRAKVVAFVMPMDDGSLGGVSNSVESLADNLGPDDRCAVVLDRTCFYTEAGGQVNDRGELLFRSARFLVEDTRRIGDVVLHIGTLEDGTFGVGDVVAVRVSPQRSATMQNHTATHLLNWALRDVLDPEGRHLQQKGSLVDPDKTRFDFSHGRPVEAAELERIEALVADRIRQNLPVETNDNQPVPLEEATKINGLRAVFGEKYPDRVRVVSIGVPVAELLKDPASERWRQYSIEFCGGTHVKRTAEIDAFALVAEEAVAKGIRRVVGITGESARRAAETGRRLIEQAETLLAAPEGGMGAAPTPKGSAGVPPTPATGGTGVPPGPADLAAQVAELQRFVNEETIRVVDRNRLRERIADLQQLVKKQQKQATTDSADVVNARIDELLPSAETLGGVTVLIAEMPEVSVELLKNGADRIKQKFGSAAVLFASAPTTGDGGAAAGGKVTLLAAVTDDLVRRGIKAGDWVKAIAPLVEGGGGGPPTMAQAGGKNAARRGEALAAGREWLVQKLG